MKAVEEMKGVRERLAHAKDRANKEPAPAASAILLHALVDEFMFVLTRAIEEEGA